MLIKVNISQNKINELNMPLDFLEPMLLPLSLKKMRIAEQIQDTLFSAKRNCIRVGK